MSFSALLSKQCSLALAKMGDVTLPHLRLHLPSCGMLPCRIFSCTCHHAGCYGAASSLAWSREVRFQSVGRSSMDGTDSLAKCEKKK